MSGRPKRNSRSTTTRSQSGLLRKKHTKRTDLLSGAEKIKTGFHECSGCEDTGLGEIGVVKTLAGDEEEMMRTDEKNMLTDDEEDALLANYQHYLGNENIVGIGVELKINNGKEREVLVFLVKKKKKYHELLESERIPKKARLDGTKYGRRLEIDTVVEESGEIIPH